jgi:hypothetical protein
MTGWSCTGRNIRGTTTNVLKKTPVDIDLGVIHTVGVHRDPLVFGAASNDEERAHWLHSAVE